MSTSTQEEIRIGDLTIRPRIEGYESGGTVAIHEFDVPAGSGLPLPHSHDAYEETIYGVAGTVTFTIEGIPTGILSNGSRAMIDRTLAASGLAGELDRVESVERARRYKPDPAVYQLAIDATRARPEATGFVTANGWDAAGAATFGLRVAWLRPTLATELPIPAEVTVATWASLLADLGV